MVMKSPRERLGALGKTRSSASCATHRIIYKLRRSAYILYTDIQAEGSMNDSFLFFSCGHFTVNQSRAAEGAWLLTLGRKTEVLLINTYEISVALEGRWE